jgi:hypothetical protein
VAAALALAANIRGEIPAATGQPAAIGIAIAPAATPPLKAEWKGKFLVFLAPEGERPLLSPDDRYLAYDYTITNGNRAVENGIGLLDLATGRAVKTALAREDTGLGPKAWLPAGRRLVVIRGNRLWAVEPEESTVRTQRVAELPLRTLFQQIIPSPDGRYLLCRTRDTLRGGHVPEFKVLDENGRVFGSFDGYDAMWSEDGLKVFFGFGGEFSYLDMLDGNQRRAFSAADFFRGRPPAPPAENWVWTLQPKAVLANDRVFLKLAALPNRSAAGSTSVYASEGQALVWNGWAAPTAFTKLGPTIQHLFKGTRDFMAADRDGTLLMIESPGKQDKTGRGTTMILVSRDGSPLKALSLPGTLRNGAREGSLAFAPLVSNLDKGIVLLQASVEPASGMGAVAGRRRAGMPALVLLDARAGTLTHVGLPREFQCAAPLPEACALASSGRTLVLHGGPRRLDSGRPDPCGLWLCDPSGSGPFRERSDKPSAPGVSPASAKPATPTPSPRAASPTPRQ